MARIQLHNFMHRSIFPLCFDRFRQLVGSTTMATQLLQGCDFFPSKPINQCNFLPLHTEQGLINFPVGKKFAIMIKLTRSRVLRLIARSILLSLIILTFPALGTILGVSQVSNPSIFERPETGLDSVNLDNLSILFHDLSNEGLFKANDHNALFLKSDDIDSSIYKSQLVNNMELISADDLDAQSKIADESLDLAFASFSGSNTALEFIDRTIKVGGIAVFRVNNDQDYSNVFGLVKPSSYKIVYLRRLQSSISLALRKIGNSNPDGTNKRHLLGYTTTTTIEEQRKAALNKLEDVLLEPPRSASRKSRQYLKRTRYLPDLMGDSLESYSRRVFIDVGLPEKEGGSGTGWFERHYPRRDLDFEIYQIETVVAEEEKELKDKVQVDVEDVDVVGVSDWLNQNVKEEEYVVMKAEAEVVEEMVKNHKAVKLVDELFLECKPRGNAKGRLLKGRRMGRAYWECLALYGRLRDEGVAVHQWWG